MTHRRPNKSERFLWRPPEGLISQYDVIWGSIVCQWDMGGDHRRYLVQTFCARVWVYEGIDCGKSTCRNLAIWNSRIAIGANLTESLKSSVVRHPRNHWSIHRLPCISRFNRQPHN